MTLRTRVVCGIEVAGYLCTLPPRHPGPHSVVEAEPAPLCGAALGGPLCSLPPGHRGLHRSGGVEWVPTEQRSLLPHQHWTGDPCPACDEGEQLQTAAALDRLIEGGVLVEERDDAGRVRHVTEWHDPDPPSYERLQGLVHLAEQVIGAVRAAVEDGHPGFEIVSTAVRRWDEA